jgi:integrase/recombinase XerC
MTSPEQVDRYLDELAQQRRQSPHTVSNYRRDLRVLVPA